MPPSHETWAEESAGSDKTYVCTYSAQQLERNGLFGGLDYAASHLAIKCAIGAVAGSSVGAKFGGVLGAASGAAAGCYLFASGRRGLLDVAVSSLDRYIGLTPTPLDECNAECAEMGQDSPNCKEVKEAK